MGRIGTTTRAYPARRKSRCIGSGGRRAAGVRGRRTPRSKGRESTGCSPTDRMVDELHESPCWRRCSTLIDGDRRRHRATGPADPRSRCRAGVSPRHRRHGCLSKSGPISQCRVRDQLSRSRRRSVNVSLPVSSIHSWSRWPAAARPWPGRLSTRHPAAWSSSSTATRRVSFRPGSRPFSRQRAACDGHVHQEPP